MTMREGDTGAIIAIKMIILMAIHQLSLSNIGSLAYCQLDSC